MSAYTCTCTCVHLTRAYMIMRDVEQKATQHTHPYVHVYTCMQVIMHNYLQSGGYQLLRVLQQHMPLHMQAGPPPVHCRLLRTCTCIYLTCMYTCVHVYVYIMYRYTYIYMYMYHPLISRIQQRRTYNRTSGKHLQRPVCPTWGGTLRQLVEDDDSDEKGKKALLLDIRLKNLFLNL